MDLSATTNQAIPKGLALVVGQVYPIEHPISKDIAKNNNNNNNNNLEKYCCPFQP